jgi:hypothetical protein
VCDGAVGGSCGKSRFIASFNVGAPCTGARWFTPQYRLASLAASEVQRQHGCGSLNRSGVIGICGGSGGASIVSQLTSMHLMADSWLPSQSKAREDLSAKLRCRLSYLLSASLICRLPFLPAVCLSYLCLPLLLAVCLFLTCCLHVLPIVCLFVLASCLLFAVDFVCYALLTLCTPRKTKSSES